MTRRELSELCAGCSLVLAVWVIVALLQLANSVFGEELHVAAILAGLACFGGAAMGWFVRSFPIQSAMVALTVRTLIGAGGVFYVLLHPKDFSISITPFVFWFITFYFLGLAADVAVRVRYLRQGDGRVRSPMS